MSNSTKRIYIERREQMDYAVRKEGSQKASAIAQTQKEAIEIARKMNPGIAPDVERVRITEKGRRDHWRRA